MDKPHMAAPRHIAVVGAGIAGLSCASALQHAGWQVSVFDAAGTVAGRMATRRAGNWQCDHGAQYFTARSAAFRAEVARWQLAGVAALWTPRLCLLAADGSAHAPAGPVERFVGMPRMNAPARWLASGLPLHLQTTITALQRGVAGWQLQTRQLGLLEAVYDGVVLAMPAPQALPLLQAHSRRLASLAAASVMQPCWAVMARYAQPLALPFDAAFVNHGPLRWVARNNSKPGRHGQESWLLHAQPEWSEAHLDWSADQVAKALLHAFAQLGGAAPLAWSTQCWQHAAPAAGHDELFAWHERSRLGLCGDWLQAGTVEGAWLSGRALAAHIAAASPSGVPKPDLAHSVPHPVLPVLV
ncbi:FAD-dependent oxidoreductase [Janthinobacterium sp. SUN118]|uniref:NAD(P)/FAD-dependent oxidoreductase n=1 Tax=Janthinobacterium sp. SUN118 TaxID=3004100 RepID=UPI0025B18571|nr:FAD-dependent oxidoreductase [Janthinobacterium sp. SUN118]MDN2710030.1 FAD-dependent oxidoreductase [Janthinobacterium sp. SUN118]